MDIAINQAAGESRHHARTGAPSGAGPAIMAVDVRRTGTGAGFAAACARAAALGFSHVLIPPPFEPGAWGDPFVVGDQAAMDRALGGGTAEAGLRALTSAAASAGVALLLDAPLDRLAAMGPTALGAGEVFTRPDLTRVLDPRGDGRGLTIAHLRDGTEAERHVAAEWWATRLAGWHALGVAGFRLLGLARCAAATVTAIAAGVRAAVPDVMLIGWTPGTSATFRAELMAASAGGSALDFVASSLAWWDFRAGWLAEDAASLRPIAPVLAATGEPFAEPGLAGAASRRLVWSAASEPAWLLTDESLSSDADLRTLNKARIGGLDSFRTLSAPGAPWVIEMRLDATDARSAGRVRVRVANASLTESVRVPAAAVLTAIAGRFELLSRVAATGPSVPVLLSAGGVADLEPGGVALFEAIAATSEMMAELDGPEQVGRAASGARYAIEGVSPAVDDGAFPARRIAGEVVIVEADVIGDGHDVMGVVMRWRDHRAPDIWHESRMVPLGNDRHRANLPLGGVGRFGFVIEAWRDGFGTFHDELTKKHAAGVETSLEVEEGFRLVAATAEATGSQGVRELSAALAGAEVDTRRSMLLSAATVATMTAADPRPFSVRTDEYPLQAERPEAGFASWYEIFPRSMSDDPHRHGSFADVVRHLPRIAGMGFDVLYFPPIHPIGTAHRKGRNNALVAGPGDPGSPYAIGSAEGGHDALHRELGDFDDFEALRVAAAEHGLELALDFAVQCSPDHPWIKQHPEWFAHRPDGTIKYAENPPKKYQDIVNVDFYGEGAVPDLWTTLRNTVLFWAERGVRLFRVDNPHTKSFAFWEWMIADVQRQYPDTVFLAEAFTRPKIMYRLAKIGFSQSYTYFTWRDDAAGLRAYLTELTTTAPREFFRPHFFVNTPDINPPFLQTGGRAAHLIRAALAATLSGLWGVYCGFELCEATPLPGREEYADSEKYQIRAWDWDRPGNIVAEITRLNAIRRANPALWSHLGVTFLDCDDPAVLWYAKISGDGANTVLVAVSTDPFGVHEPLVGLASSDVVVEDLLVGGTDVWHGSQRRLRLAPDRPYAIWRATQP